MARRKKTALLKADYEDLLARIEKAIQLQIEQADGIAERIGEDKRAYYYGRRGGLMSLRDFINRAKDEYLKG